MCNMLPVFKHVCGAADELVQHMTAPIAAEDGALLVCVTVTRAHTMCLKHSGRPEFMTQPWYERLPKYHHAPFYGAAGKHFAAAKLDPIQLSGSIRIYFKTSTQGWERC